DRIGLVAALYRKYRPHGFDDVVGQEPVVRTLKNAIDAGQIRQAYLFAGPRGTGKTSLARILAKALNCEKGTSSHPDTDCHICRAIAAGTSLDVVEMDAASQRGIDDIRDIRDHAVLQPRRGPLQALHPRRAAPPPRRPLHPPAEPERGPPASPDLRFLHDRPREDAPDRPLALSDIRVRAAAPAGARAGAPPRLRRRGNRGA